MNAFLICVSSFLVIGSIASDIIASELTTEFSVTDEAFDESPVGSNKCSKKCSQEIEGLKKNITELFAAYKTLQSQLEHLNQHMSFHEKALKHIAIWGHKPHPHNDKTPKENNQDSARNESALNEEQNQDLNRSMRGQSNHHHLHDHRHQHHNHQPHIHRPHGHVHNHHHHNCGQTPPCQQGGQKGSQNEDMNKKIGNIKDNTKDSSEESSEEETKVSMTTVMPNSELDVNESSALINSKTNPSEGSPKKVHLFKPSVKEQLYFQSMQTEFKEWFSNMLNDIHHNHERVDRSDNGIKIDRRLGQSAIDEMENALNSEDLVFATCNVKPNRHITLLNQQDVEGTINLWQLKHNRGPLHMHIKLKGFKVHNHEDSHKHNDHNVRRVRESILLPVEVEPDDTTPPVGASHSHGFHVHEFGNMSRDCQSVGSHYNPLKLSHGGPYDVIRHVGDLGNIRCDQNGVIDSEFSYSHISLTGLHSIINRSLVIHSNVDDYGRNPNSPSSVETGSSGVRIACCVIEEVKELPKEVDSQSSIGSVGSPVITSKRRRDTSAPIHVNTNRFVDSTLGEILKKMRNHENREYKTIEFN